MMYIAFSCCMGSRGSHPLMVTLGKVRCALCLSDDPSNVTDFIGRETFLIPTAQTLCPDDAGFLCFHGNLRKITIYLYFPGVCLHCPHIAVFLVSQLWPYTALNFSLCFHSFLKDDLCAR